jgi:GATA-binding protein
MFGALSGGERGGLHVAFPDDFDFADRPSPTSSSSPRHARLPPAAAQFDYSSGSNSAVQSIASNSTLDSKLELSPEDVAARKGMLEHSIFPSFQNDADAPCMKSPEEMQQDDPLATQIWRLYSKARAQLPNAERMENLTWRMMAMSMRRAELDRNRGYGKRHVTTAPSACDCTSRC